MYKKLANKIMLITYADSLGKNLNDLRTVLDTWYRDAAGGLHILPFFPSSGDRGYAPVSYDEVFSDFGSWQDVEEPGKEYYLMFDFMINHISRRLCYFTDYIKNHEKPDWSWCSHYPSGCFCLLY